MQDLFVDGGVCGKNGQAQAGTWAWCLVKDDQIVRSASGFVTVEDVVPYTHVTNNVTELIALVYALEAMPQGWSGQVFTDSQNALHRVCDGWAMNNVPQWLQDRVRKVLWHLGKSGFTLLGGHPERCSLKEQEAGIRQDGLPLSKWNAWCDGQCNQKKAEALEYMASKKPPALPTKDEMNLAASKKAAAEAVPATMADERHVKGVEAPNIRKRDIELFDVIRADLARLIVAEQPLVYGHLSDADKWAKAHREARVIFGWVLDCVARNGAHITKAYPGYLRELLEAVGIGDKEKVEQLDAKHGIGEEIAAADRGESATATESLQSKLERTYPGQEPVDQKASNGVLPGL